MYQVRSARLDFVDLFYRVRQWKWVFRAQLHVRMCQRMSAFGTKYVSS